jgi:hypothetical protein
VVVQEDGFMILNVGILKQEIVNNKLTHIKLCGLRLGILYLLTGIAQSTLL